MNDENSKLFGSFEQTLKQVERREKAALKSGERTMTDVFGTIFTKMGLRASALFPSAGGRNTKAHTTKCLTLPLCLPSSILRLLSIDDATSCDICLLSPHQLVLGFDC